MAREVRYEIIIDKELSKNPKTRINDSTEKKKIPDYHIPTKFRYVNSLQIPLCSTITRRTCLKKKIPENDESFPLILATITNVMGRVFQRGCTDDNEK